MIHTTKSLRRMALTGAVVVALLGVSACSRSDDGASASDPSGGDGGGGSYTIPLIADLSGTGVSANGIAGAAGFRTAIDEINESGGVDGHEIELVSVDSLGTPEGATAAAVQVVADEPIAIVAQVASNGLAATSSTLDQAGIPFVSATFDDALTGPPPRPWFFTSSPSASQNAAFLVSGAEDLLDGSLEGKAIAIAGAASAGAEATFQQAEDLVEEAGGEVVADERTSGYPAPSYQAEASRVASADPDAVLMFDGPANVVLMANALADAGFDGIIVNGTSGNDDVTLSTVAGDFHTVRVFPALEDSERMSAAAEAAGTTDDAENALFANGYIGGLVLAAGLEECGFPCSAQDLLEALETVGEIDAGDAAFGVLTISPDDHVAPTAAQIYRWDPDAEAAEPVGDPIEA